MKHFRSKQDSPLVSDAVADTSLALFVDGAGSDFTSGARGPNTAQISGGY